MSPAYLATYTLRYGGKRPCDAMNVSCHAIRFLLATLLLAASGGCSPAVRVAMPPSAATPARPHAPRAGDPSTFSIAAFDPEKGDLGVAVASRFLAVGSVVPWAEAGQGAIATQAYANTSYGPRGLALLRDGWSPRDAARYLLDEDPEKDFRQVGIVDARGHSFSFTGKSCRPWAGSRSGDNFAIQGNILVSAATLDAMQAAFKTARGELAERLLAALEAGEAAGGDSRGRQSAALVVSRRKGGYGGFDNRYIDLRVDDHPAPASELRRLLFLRLGRSPLDEARRRERVGDREGALEILEEAVRRHPRWLPLRFEIARLLFLLGKPAGGREELRLAVAGDPFNPHCRYRAAGILAGAGLEAECLERLRETLSLNKEYARLLERDLESSAHPLHRFRKKILPLIQQ